MESRERGSLSFCLRLTVHNSLILSSSPLTGTCLSGAITLPKLLITSCFYSANLALSVYLTRVVLNIL